MSGVTIRCFDFNDQAYMHQIFCDEDDRIELINEAGKVILTFDSSSNVFDNDKQQIGKLHLEKVNGSLHWVFRSTDRCKIINGGSFKLPEAHIDLEVDVSKWYLSLHPR